MEKLDIFKGVRIEPTTVYFAQVLNVGIEGRVTGIEEGYLVFENGREFDLREVIGFGYEGAKKHIFVRREVPLDSVRTFQPTKKF